MYMRIRHTHEVTTNCAEHSAAANTQCAYVLRFFFRCCFVYIFTLNWSCKGEFARDLLLCRYTGIVRYDFGNSQYNKNKIRLLSYIICDMNEWCGMMGITERTVKQITSSKFSNLIWFFFLLRAWLFQILFQNKLIDCLTTVYSPFILLIKIHFIQEMHFRSANIIRLLLLHHRNSKPKQHL